MMDSTVLLLDASVFFNNNELSDVTIILTEDVPRPLDGGAVDEPPAKRQKTDALSADGDNQQAPQPRSADGNVATAQTGSVTMEERLQEQVADDAGQLVELEQADPSPAAASADQRSLCLYGHKVLLSAGSSVLKTRITNWSAGEGNSNELTLQVPSIEVGELLIRCIYSPQPQLQECSQQQLLQLITLADSLDAKKVVYAASNQLQQIPVVDLEWDTAMAIYSLPPGCPDLPAYKLLYQAAAARVQQELGDLEQPWRNDELCRKLYDLPHIALLQLLSNPATRVSSENTIAYTIQQWAAAQQNEPTLQEMKQLTEHIRMGQCTALFAGTCMFAWPMIAQCFSTQEMLVASLLASQSEQQSAHTAQQAGEHKAVKRCSILRQHPTWLLAARPASEAKDSFQEEAPIELEVLQQVVDSALQLASSGPGTYKRLCKYTLSAWQGRRFAVFWRATVTGTAATADASAGQARQTGTEEAAAAASAAAAAAGTTTRADGGVPAGPGAATNRLGTATCMLSVGLGQIDMPVESITSVKYKLTVAAAPAVHFAEGNEVHDVETPWRKHELSREYADYIRDFFQIGQFSSAIEMERKLRDKGVVQANGTLKCTVRMKGKVR